MSDQINDGGKSNKARTVCAITGNELPRNRAVHLDAVRPSLVERIRKDHPDLKDDAFVSRAELDRYHSLSSPNRFAQRAAISAILRTR